MSKILTEEGEYQMSKILTEENIMELIIERGFLRYSTLMLIFHISSTEAKKIVEEYKEKGIIDENGRYGKSERASWKRDNTKFREEESRWNEQEMDESEEPVEESPVAANTSEPITMPETMLSPQQQTPPKKRGRKPKSEVTEREKKSSEKKSTQKNKNNDIMGQLTLF